MKALKAARTAGRCNPGVTCDARLLSCFCPSPLNPPSGLPLPWDLSKPDEAKQSAVRGRKRRREAGRSALTSRRFLLPCSCHFSCKIVFPDSGAQRPQHRVLTFRRCTDATQPTTGPHKPSQGLTRVFAVLGCSARCSKWSLAENTPMENMLSALRFLNFLRTLGLSTGDAL